MADWLNPIIGAASSMLSSVWNRSQERKEYNRMLKYNSPKAQMQRYREAGLSPYLIYGQGNPGNVSSPAPANQAPVEQGFDRYVANQQAKNENSISRAQLKSLQLDNSLKMGEQQAQSMNNLRNELSLYADFPTLLSVHDTVNGARDIGSNSYRRKANELKLASSDAMINKIRQAIAGMQSDNLVKGVKAHYATEYGMVGGDWTQGLGLIKSLPSFFKSRAKTPMAVPGKFNRQYRTPQNQFTY